ncbi:hypothetical protein O6H91_07G071200 [Diphasiastrum complanatum]|nr:hypothetical protein O6H91_07G071200 [Diphasiastrum complanatum]
MSLRAKFFSDRIKAGILMGASICLLALEFDGGACAMELGLCLSENPVCDLELTPPTPSSDSVVVSSYSFAAPLCSGYGAPVILSTGLATNIYSDSSISTFERHQFYLPVKHFLDSFSNSFLLFFHDSIEGFVKVFNVPNSQHHSGTIITDSEKYLRRGSHSLVLLGGNPITGACVESADAGEKDMDVMGPEEVTNESLVEEAWQVVNEVFLDARHQSWSQADWLKMKEQIFKRPIHSRMAAYAAIRSMLSTLDDPFTRFLTPGEFTKMSKYDITGIGINIGESRDENGDNHLKVLGIVLGSPAQLAGIREGDELLSVEGNSVVGKTAFEASSLIQGPKGRPVSIEVKHGPCGQSRKLVIERQQDVRTPVYYRLENSKESSQLIGYIRLKEFNALAKRDLVIAMKRLRDAGASSFLLDLRDNLGGLVQAGIEIARLFLEEGETVVYTVGREAGSARNIMATGHPLTRAPLIVLVNDQTASASEIVAAALHDNCRAILVGRKTFGKGLIQSVYELSDGSGIVLTVGKYVTPAQHDIDRNGIEPDFIRVPRLSEAREKLRRCHTPKQFDVHQTPVISFSKMPST